MADVRKMLAVVLLLLELCVLAGVVHGFVVEQPDGPDNAWRFSVDGDHAVDDPVLAHEQGGHLVGELKDFQINGFESYGAGRGANVNQFPDHSFADLAEQFSTRDVSANQFQEQFDTQEGSSSGDEPGYVYNARLQSNGASGFETNDVDVAGASAESDGAVSYDYNRFSTRSEGFSAPASQFNRDQSSASYVLGVSEEREEEARPDYVYDARSGNHGGNADGASFTSSDSVQQQGSSDDQVVPAKGHEGPVSYYTPASDRNGAFVFYDTRSDEDKKLSSEVDGDSPGSASFASSDTTTSASTSPVILAPQRAPQATHGCPNSYWAEHVEQWPAPLKITTLVSQAFGGSTVKKNLEIIYGTTTLFQALLDTRDDPYSKLLRNAVAALLNAHAKTNYTLRPEDVARLFNSALTSKAAAAAQAQKFENENHSFGDIECK